jgi:hypothetical protein
METQPLILVFFALCGAGILLSLALRPRRGREMSGLAGLPRLRLR